MSSNANDPCEFGRAPILANLDLAAGHDAQYIIRASVGFDHRRCAQHSVGMFADGAEVQVAELPPDQFPVEMAA